MSGIVGVWNLDGRPLEDGLLEKLAAPIAHRGPDGRFFWSEGPVGLGCLLMRVTPESLSEVQPLVSEHTVVVFDGRLDCREELLEALGSRARVTKESPDPDLILAGWEAFGDSLFARLNGDFALAIYDRRNRRLLLVRDPIGVRPLYYTQAGDTFLFASEIKSLLAHPLVTPRPNDVTLAGYLLAFRNMPPGETFFEGIHSVQPSHRLEVRPEKVKAEQYWDFDLTRRIRYATFDEYADAFREHFEGAVRRRLRSAFPVAISVSGGLDSSSIFCMAHALRQKYPSTIPEIVGITYCPSDGSPADESQYIRDLEQHCGVRVERVPLDPPAYGDLETLMEEAWTVEAPSLSGRPRSGDSVVDAARGHRARTILTGHYGDQFLSDLAYLQDLFLRLRWITVARHLKEFASWNADVNPRYYPAEFFSQLLRNILPSFAFLALKQIRNLVLRRKPHGFWYGPRLHEALSRLPCPPAPAARATWHARSMYHEARRTYHAFCMDWNNKSQAVTQIEHLYPFLDRGVIAFLCAIPGEVQMRGGIPKAMLRFGMRGLVPDSILGRRWKADFTHVGNAALAEAKDDLSVLLGVNSRAVVEGYLRAGAMPPPPAPGAADFNGRDVLALEVWLRVFFGDRQRALTRWEVRQTGRKEVCA